MFVPLRVDFSKMAAVAMETTKMLKKNEKHKKRNKHNMSPKLRLGDIITLHLN
jgi:hypothetical protein